MEGSPQDGKNSLAAGMVVQVWGHPPRDTQGYPGISTDTQEYPQKPGELAGAWVAFQSGKTSSSLPCLCSTWEVAAGGSLPCGGTGDNGAASLINSGSGC